MISDGNFSPPTSQPPLGTSAQATPVVSSLLGGTGAGSGAEPRFLPNFPPLGPPRCLGAVSRTNTAVTTALGRQPLVSAAAGAAAGGNATQPPVSVAVSSAASAPSALGRTYAKVGGPSRTGANGFRRVAPHIAAQPGMPVPTHQGRKWTVLADIKPVRPNHTREERAQFVLRDLGAPPTSLLQAYVLHVDQLLLISFRDEAAYEAALDRLQRGVPWGAAGGRKVYGHSTLDLCLNVRVDNVPIEVPDHVVTEVLEEYGRVLTPKRGTLPGTVDVYDGILHCRMRLHPGVVLPDFIALEIQGQVLDEVCRIMTDVHVRRCFKCGQTNHVGQACRFAAKTIKQQGAVWTRAWYAEEDVEVPAPRTRPAAGPPPVHRPPLSGGPRPSAGTQGSQGLVAALPGGISVSLVLEVTMDREVAEVERDQGKKQESEPFFSLSGQLGASMPLVAPLIASSPPTVPPMASGPPAGPPVATGPLTGPPKEEENKQRRQEETIIIQVQVKVAKVKGRPRLHAVLAVEVGVTHFYTVRGGVLPQPPVFGFSSPFGEAGHVRGVGLIREAGIHKQAACQTAPDKVGQESRPPHTRLGEDRGFVRVRVYPAANATVAGPEGQGPPEDGGQGGEGGEEAAAEGVLSAGLPRGRDGGADAHGVGTA